MELTLSELQRRDVWENWLAAEIREDYFADMAGHYRRQQIALTWLTFVLSSGASTTILISYHALASVLALLTTAVSVFLVVQQSQKRVTDCSDLSFKWSRLASDYKALWDEMYSEEAPARFRVLDEKVSELSKSGHSLPHKPELMLKWQIRVQQQHGLATPA